jgi:hypothetical protein
MPSSRDTETGFLGWSGVSLALGIGRVIDWATDILLIYANKKDPGGSSFVLTIMRYGYFNNLNSSTQTQGLDAQGCFLLSLSHRF